MSVAVSSSSCESREVVLSWVGAASRWWDDVESGGVDVSLQARDEPSEFTTPARKPRCYYCCHCLHLAVPCQSQEDVSRPHREEVAGWTCAAPPVPGAGVA